jgi:hypothetical protein
MASIEDLRAFVAPDAFLGIAAARVLRLVG